MGESSATETPGAVWTEAAEVAEAVRGPPAFLAAGRADVIAVGVGRKHAQAAIAASRWSHARRLVELLLALAPSALFEWFAAIVATADSRRATEGRVPCVKRWRVGLPHEGPTKQ
jgi:hypothetical protein